MEGVGFPNARWVVTHPPGVEQAATGSIVCTSGMWEVLYRCFLSLETNQADRREHASEREGWRRRHSSQTLSCNGADRVKVRQERALRQRDAW